MTENDPPRPHPSSRLVFDKTIQLGTLISMFTLAATGIGGGFAVYENVQTQLYEQRVSAVSAAQKIETLSVDLRVVKDSIVQLKLDQKEQDNALRKSLDAIADDLLKVRLSLASRGRSRLFCPSDDGSYCWPDGGLGTPISSSPAASRPQRPRVERISTPSPRPH